MYFVAVPCCFVGCGSGGKAWISIPFPVPATGYGEETGAAIGVRTARTKVVVVGIFIKNMTEKKPPPNREQGICMMSTGFPQVLWVSCSSVSTLFVI